MLENENYAASDFAQTVQQQTHIVKVIEAHIRLRRSGAKVPPLPR